MNKKLIVLIPAEGRSARFRSETPKALYPILGRPMASLILDAARALSPAKICALIGNRGEEQIEFFLKSGVEIIRQKKPLGTGRAVLSAGRLLEAHRGGDVLIVRADLPLITALT